MGFRGWAACNLNPSLKQAQEVHASPVQGKGGSSLKKGLDRTRTVFLASFQLGKGREAEGVNAAADAGECERNVLPLSADQVGGVPGITCLPGGLLSLQAIPNVTDAEERSAHLGKGQAEKPFRPQSSSEV